MNSRPTPSEQRKRFEAFANQIRKGTPLTDDQLEWLKCTFLALSDPDRDVMRVLGLNYTAGHSAKKEIAAQKMDFLMHWIAGAISPDNTYLADPEHALPPLSLEEAFEKAAEIAKVLFKEDPNSTQYDSSYIRKCWYDSDKRHRQSPDRHPFDPGTYYSFPIDC
jgi:hypothetical protein